MRMPLLALTVVLALMATQARAATVSVDYSNDFEPDNTTIAAFTASANSGTTTKSWVEYPASSGNRAMQLSNGGSGDSRSYISAAVNFDNFGGSNAVQDFTMEGDITIASGSSSGSSGLKWLRVGMVALGANDTLSNTGYFFGLQVFTGTGQTAPSTDNMFIATSWTLQNATTVATADLYDNLSNFTFNTTYSLTVNGELLNGGNDLKLTFTVDDGTTSKSISYTDVGFTRKGDYAGFTINNNRATASPRYDNFSFTVVPEPSAIALAVCGVGCILTARRHPRHR